MKNFKKWSFTAVLLMMVSVVFSQGKITGSVVDSDLKGSLPGATVSVKGTKTAAATDMDGKFTLNVTTASGQLVISYVGFDSKTINFSVSGGKTVDLGAVVLTSNANSLDEVVVKSSVVDVAKDRKTPVAVFHADCLARGRFLFDRIIKEELVSKMQNPFYVDGNCPPWLGMYGFGEFARLGGKNEYHNYTTALYVIYR
jgi:hypothetical protein